MVLHLYREPAVFFLIVMLIILFSSVIFVNFILNRGPMMWDESEHSMTSLILSTDLAQLNFSSFFIHAHEKILWPFVHPMLLSAFILLFGKSIVISRLFSLLVFACATIACFFLGREMSQKNPHIAGFLCAVFFMTTESLWLSASEVMLEITALLFFILTIITLFRYHKNPRLSPLIAVFALLTFFSRSNFGIPLIIALFVHFLIYEKFSLKKMVKNRGFCIIFLVIGIGIMLWLFPLERLLFFVKFLFNRPEGPSPLSIEGMVTYPSLLYLFSGPILILHIILSVFAFRSIKNPKISFLFLIVFLTVAINFFHPNKKIRYILYFYPVLFSLSSFALAQLYEKISIKRKGFLFFFIVVFITGLFYLHASQRIFAGGGYYSIDEPLMFVKENLGSRKDIFTVGEFNQLSSAFIAWNISSMGDIRRVVPLVYAIPEFETVDGFSEVPKKPNPDGFRSYLGSHRFDAIVLIYVYNTSFFYQNDDFQNWNKWKQAYIPLARENKNYTPIAEKSFDIQGIKIEILGNLIGDGKNVDE